MKVAIVALSVLPVPAVKGGAVETLVEYIIRENERLEEVKLTVYSIYDKKAEIEAAKFTKTNFKYIKINKYFNKIYRINSIIIRKFLKIINHSLYDKILLKELIKEDFDKIIFEGYTEAPLLVKRYINNDSILMHIHHDAFKNLNSVNRKVFESCNKIITVSHYIKKQTELQFKNDTEKIKVLKNCTDTTVFNKELYLKDRSQIRKKFNLRESDIVVMFTGRIVVEKGIKELIEAFKIINNDNIKLLIVGNAGFGNEIRTKFDDELGKISEDIKEKIIFTGFIHNSELPKIHAAVDIAVVPSIWDDPAPLVVFEAMASGLPLVVTDSGGIPEYTNEHCAITIKRDKHLVNNIAKSLMMLAEDKSLREHMGRSGREHSLKYTVENYYKDFISIVKG